MPVSKSFVSIVFLLLGIFFVSEAASPWPQSLGNAQRTSATGVRCTSQQPTKFLWNVTLGEYTIPEVLLAGDGSVLAIAYSNSAPATRGLYALNKATGATKWKYTATDTYNTGITVGPDGTIYIAPHRLSLKLIALKDGNPPTVKWSKAWNPEGFGANGHGVAPLLGPDGTLYVIDIFSVSAWNSTNGNLKWTYPFPNGNSMFPDGPLSLSSDGSMVFYQTAIAFFALNAKTGALKWSNSTNADATGHSRVTAAPDGTLLTGFSKYVVNGKTGARKYQLPEFVWSQYALAQGIAVFGGNVTAVVAINATTGQKKWSTVVPNGRIASTPVIDVPDGTVYVFDELNRQLLAVNFNTGAIKWKFDVGSNVMDAFPTFLAFDPTVGVVYWSDSNKVYAVKVCVPPASSSPSRTRSRSRSHTRSRSPSRRSLSCTRSRSPSRRSLSRTRSRSKSRSP